MVCAHYFKPLFICVFFSTISFSSWAQLEKVFVETYYVSDLNDATDTTGGKLEDGSKTYRIYVDLVNGSKLKKIYGDAYHPLKISSSAFFFNNQADGQTFGKDFSKNRYSDNTVALDTWITLGQTTKSTSGFAHYGVPKTDDDNGSFVGGANNDGGSSAVIGGLLVNNNPQIGIPLTISDGMDTLQTIPTNWGDYGFRDFISGNDSTIFGSIKKDSVFISYNASLQNGGVSGVIADSNQVLLAQLTTKGEISFELNIEVVDSNGVTYKYVASNVDTVFADETLFPGLKYPPVCGCTDGNYLEYNSRYSCLNQDSCKTLVVLGCMDPLACNFNPYANVSVNSTCCYPGACNDLDISLVCPTLSVWELEGQSTLTVYPNPVSQELFLKFSYRGNQPILFTVFDMTGRVVLQEKADSNLLGDHQAINLSGLSAGSYYIRAETTKIFFTKLFVKK